MSEHTQQDVLSVFSTAPAVWLIRRVCVNGEMWEVCLECREADFSALKLSKVWAVHSPLGNIVHDFTALSRQRTPWVVSQQQKMNLCWTCSAEVSEPSWDALSNLTQQDCNTLKSLTNQRCVKNHSTCCDHLPQSDEEIWSLLIAVWGPRPHVTTLKHHLLAAPVVTLHHAWPIAAAWVLSCFSGLRLGLVQVRCRRRAGLLSVWGHGDAEAHAESLVARDVVEAAGVLGRVVADGGVLVGALRARKRKTVWTQEIIQVLVAVARWQGCTAVAAVQREREATKPRVPAGVHGGGGVSVFYDVKLREILDRRTAVIVRVCGVDWGQEAEEELWLLMVSHSNNQLRKSSLTSNFHLKCPRQTLPRPLLLLHLIYCNVVYHQRQQLAGNEGLKIPTHRDGVRTLLRWNQSETSPHLLTLNTGLKVGFKSFNNLHIKHSVGVCENSSASPGHRISLRGRRLIQKHV